MAYTDVCGKKLQAKLGAQLNESAAIHTPLLLSADQSFAKRQLEKMGWTEGAGLGKRGDGMKQHVKIKQREDEMGLGREKEMAKEIGNVWWKDSVGGTLARLQAQKKKKNSDKESKKKRKKDKKKSSKSNKSGEEKAGKIFTDQELFEATGGARFGMRAQRRAEGKWKRTESGTELAELEKKARADLEWNGRGSAKVVIKEKEPTKKKRKLDLKEENATTVSPSISEEENESNEEEDKRSKKKRRKAEKETKTLKKQITMSASDEDEEGADDSVDKESEKKKSKKKKEKKSKKSSKK